MRKCYVCKKIKPLNSFGFKSKKLGTRHYRCKQCQKEQFANWYLVDDNKKKHISRARRNNIQRNDIARKNILSYLQEHPCIECGITDPDVLVFDHVKGVKEFNISDGYKKYSWKVIKKEIEKCEVRCANCHTKRHAIARLPVA